MINEEIESKTLSIAVRVGKVTAAEIRRALEKIIDGIQQGKAKKPGKSKNPKEPELKHGKLTLKKLQKHNDELSSVELKDPELRRLCRAMKRDNIDFAAVKDGKGKYTLFFKAKDADVMTHAFKRYTDKVVKRTEKRSIRAELKIAKTAAKALETGRDKVKNRSRGARDL